MKKLLARQSKEVGVARELFGTTKLNIQDAEAYKKSFCPRRSSSSN